MRHSPERGIADQAIPAESRKKPQVQAFALRVVFVVLEVVLVELKGRERIRPRAEGVQRIDLRAQVRCSLE